MSGLFYKRVWRGEEDTDSPSPLLCEAAMHTFPHRLPLLLLLGACAGADWPAWRGPTGRGHTAEKDLPLKWHAKTGENVLWKAPLPGADGKGRQDQNQSSPIVQGGRVFVTASHWPMGVGP